jgi:hypothetical protein
MCIDVRIQSGSTGCPCHLSIRYQTSQNSPAVIIYIVLHMSPNISHSVERY